MVESISLESRVAKLERAARRWKIVAFVAFVGLAGLGAAEAVRDASFGKVTVRELELVDENGTMLGSLSATKDRSGERVYGGLVLTDSVKKKAIVLTPGDRPGVFPQPD